MHNCKAIVEIYFENNNEYVNTKYVCTRVFNYTLLMQSVMQKFLFIYRVAVNDSHFYFIYFLSDTHRRQLHFSVVIKRFYCF